MIKKNVYIRDNQNKRINFYEEFDDCWLGIKDTPHEFFEEVKEQDYLTFVDLKGKTIEEYKKEKIEELSLKKELMLETIKFRNQILDSDDKSLIRFLSAESKFEEFKRKFGFEKIAWKTYNNDLMELSKQDLNDIILMIFKNESLMRIKLYPKFKDRINSANDKATIDNIMKEFFNLDLSLL